MRKRCRRKVAPLVNPVSLVLANLAPADRATTQRVLTAMYAALDALQFGRATTTDWNDLAEAANHGYVFSKELGLGPEHLGLFVEARQVLIQLGERYHERGRFVATAQELQTLHAMAAVHDLQLQAANGKEAAVCAARVAELKRSAPKYSPKRTNGPSDSAHRLLGGGAQSHQGQHAEGATAKDG